MFESYEDQGHKIDQALLDETMEWDREVQEERFPVERAVIGWDIDSTVSESQWRAPLINNWDAETVLIEDREGLSAGGREDGMWEYDFRWMDREARWDKFYSLGEYDKPYEIAQGLIGQLRELYDIVYVTGRPEKWRSQTVAWLLQNDLLPLGASSLGPAELFEQSRSWLLMRPNGWYAPAAEVKMTLLDRYEGGLPFLFFDDDVAVVQALNLEGIAASMVLWHGGEPRGLTRG